MKLGRDAFYGVLDQSADDALRMLHAGLTVVTQTEDAAEGIRAFQEKRPPSLDWALAGLSPLWPAAARRGKRQRRGARGARRKR